MEAISKRQADDGGAHEFDPLIFQEVDKLLLVYLSLYDHIHNKRRQLELDCAGYQRLLKPCPSNRIADQTGGGDVTGLPPLPAGTPSEESAGQIPTEHEPEVVPESKEVTLINSLLAKAHKARDVRQKVDKTDRHEPVHKTSTDKTGTKNFEGKSNVVPADHRKDQIKSADFELGRKNPSSRVINSSTSKSEPDQRMQKGDGSVVRNISERTSSASRSHINKPTGPRASSATRRNAIKTPAHMTAPFKTEPEKLVFKRPISKWPPSKPTSALSTNSANQKLSANQHKEAKRKSGSDVELTNRKAPIDTPCVETFKCDRFEEGKIDMISHRKDSERADKGKLSGIEDGRDQNLNMTNNHVIHNSSKILQKNLVQKDDVADKMQTLQISDKYQNDPSSRGAEDPSGATGFDLLKDGSSLSVPPKLRRQFARNVSLRQKLDTARLTVKVSSDCARDHFLDRLQQEEESAPNVKYGFMINKNIQLHRQLLAELDKLHLDEISDQLTVGEVLRTRMMLEFILGSYDEAGDEIAALIEGKLKPDVQDICEEYIELPPIRHSTEKDLFSPDMPVDSNRVSSILPSLLEYKSERHLLKYVTLQHETELLRQQSYIMDTMLKEFLPLLESESEHKMDSFVQLYRAVYSLVASIGGQLPTVVCDTIDELDD